MTQAIVRLLLVSVVGLCGAVPAAAELVYFGNGRTIAVKSYRIEGESLVLTLRAGGDLSSAPVGSASRAQVELSTSRYEPIIQRMAAAHGVDPTLVRAVIQVESAYQPRARSPKGAVGLMQVMPATGRQYGIDNLWDPASNIEAGITHLRSLLDRFPLSLALAAYNAGEAAVQRFSGIPPYPETRNYVSRILKLVGR
jgi:soluble lytic murein transglycosylase-like protein